MKTNCITCNETFNASPSDKGRKNCSRACSLTWRAANRSPKRSATALCECGCGQVIMAYHAVSYRRIRFAKGHSHLPGIKAAKSPQAIAKMAAAKRGGEPWIKGKNSTYRGEKHWNWKGGITRSSRLERQRFLKYYQHKVLARDEYTCQMCNVVGGDLQVDHIQGWAEHPELRFDLANCRTLCMSCHYQHTFGRPLQPGIVWGQNLSKAVA